MDHIINLVNDYIQKELPHLQGAEIHLDTQDGSNDQHFAKSPLLPDVTEAHVNNDDYHVATVSGTVTVDDGTVIPKLIKLTIKNNEINRVIESK